ncbi:hypothetical protein NQ318_013760 [Aromia moschata]|uniref:Uncharacterized protein n=1 Tax=Aromia moschata TaxID=1265417 RepID=A0AAV8ZAS2_9CUCU|nr:hypothetical protein NQ318_013760 [Aromia moschata]
MCTITISVPQNKDSKNVFESVLFPTTFLSSTLTPNLLFFFMYVMATSTALSATSLPSSFTNTTEKKNQYASAFLGFLNPVRILKQEAEEEKAELARLSSFVGAIAIGRPNQEYSRA